AFLNLPGAAITVVVPTGQTALLVARYSGESACYGGTGAQWCTVRILVNGVEMDPVVGTDFAFDGTDNSTESFASWESHAMERTKKVGAGTYRLLVQWRTTSSTTSFRLDDSAFTVERAQP